MKPLLPPPIRPTPLTKERREEMQLQGATPLQIAAVELRGEGHSEVDTGLILLRRAHGHLCNALGHLYHAAALFAEDRADICGKIRHHAAKLSEIVPGYEEFEAATKRPADRLRS